MFVALAMSSVTLPAMAQTRGSGVSRPRQGSTARHPGTSQPLPPSAGTIPPLRSPLVPTPAPTRGGFRARSPWFGFVLFDPCSWSPIAIGPTFLPVPASPSTDSRSTGGLQLDVEPRRAAVYVDGSYAGLVQDFSGYYYHLDLLAGPHTIEIAAADYDPLVVEVAVTPGRTTTYRGWLNHR